MIRMEERKTLLDIRRLSKQFPIRSKHLFGKTQTLYAVDDVTIRIYEGETLGIIGESGCGKSTLGRMVVGLHQPTSGEIFYDGDKVDTQHKRGYDKIRKSVQMVFQDPYSSLDPRTTCGDLVAEPLIIHGLCPDRKEREKRVASLLEEVGLSAQHIYRYPHEFSGGQRQRINVARALALNPRLIVCDEPVSALDVSIQAQVLNLLNRLQREYNLSYMFISHDLSVIKHISDRIAIMYLGRVVELCSAEEIYKHPLHPYTQALLSAIPPSSPFEKKERITLKGDVPSPIGKRAECPLAKRCPHCTERCRKETPQLRECEKGHFVACFQAEG